VTDLLRREEPERALPLEETVVLPNDLYWLVRDGGNWKYSAKPEFEPITGSLTAITEPVAEDTPRTRRPVKITLGPRLFGVALLAAIGAGTWMASAGSFGGGTALTGEAAPAPQALPGPHAANTAAAAVRAPSAPITPPSANPAVASANTTQSTPARPPARSPRRVAPPKHTTPAPPAQPSPITPTMPVWTPPSGWGTQPWQPPSGDPGYPYDGGYGYGGDYGSHGQDHHSHRRH
jgi:hypothetical protein